VAVWAARGPLGYRLYITVFTKAIVIPFLLVPLVSPAWAGPVRCTPYDERTIGRLQTICDDGMRAVPT
jgi:hypothetical protein